MEIVERIRDVARSDAARRDWLDKLRGLATHIAGVPAAGTDLHFDVNDVVFEAVSNVLPVSDVPVVTPAAPIALVALAAAATAGMAAPARPSGAAGHEKPEWARRDDRGATWTPRRTGSLNKSVYATHDPTPGYVTTAIWRSLDAAHVMLAYKVCTLEADRDGRFRLPLGYPLPRSGGPNGTPSPSFACCWPRG